MTDHDALAALPLTPEAEAALRAWAASFRPMRVVEATHLRDVTRLLATLDAARGVRVTGDAGLRAAAQAVVESWAAVDVAVTGTLDGAEILRRGDALRDALDVLRREYAALTGDTPNTKENR